MTPKEHGVAKSVRVAALLLTAGLAFVAGVHFYWALGGAWALHASSGGGIEEPSWGTRSGGAIVVALIVVWVLALLARVGLWRQTFVSGGVIRVMAWVLAVVMLAEALMNFAATNDWQRFIQGPFALVLAVLALAVASGGARTPAHRRLPRGAAR